MTPLRDFVNVVPVSPGLSPPLVYLVVGSNLINRRVAGAASGGLRPRSISVPAIEDGPRLHPDEAATPEQNRKRSPTRLQNLGPVPS
jgi:hypothetical protein